MEEKGEAFFAPSGQVLTARVQHERPAAPSDLLTLDQVAEKLGCKGRAVERMIEGRKIPVIRINRRVLRFRWREVEAALAKLTVKAL
jgi:excisionase family DNA binding protein